MEQVLADGEHEDAVAVLGHAVVLGIEDAGLGLAVGGGEGGCEELAVAERFEHAAPLAEVRAVLLVDECGDVLLQQHLGSEHAHGVLGTPQHRRACAAALGDALALAGLTDALAVMHDGSVGGVGVVGTDLHVIHRDHFALMLDMVDGHPQVAVLVECLVLRVVGLLEAHDVEVALAHPPSLYLGGVRHGAMGDGERSVIDLGDALSEAEQQRIADAGEVVAAVALAEVAVAVLVAHDEVAEQMRGQGHRVGVDVLGGGALAVSLAEGGEFLAIDGEAQGGALAVQRVSPAEVLQCPLYGQPVGLALGTAADDHGLVRLVVAHPAVAQIATHQVPEVLLFQHGAQPLGVERVATAEVEHRAMPVGQSALGVDGIAQIVVLGQPCGLLPLWLAERPQPFVAVAVAGADVEGVVVGAAYLVAEHRLHRHHVAVILPLHRRDHLSVLVGVGQHTVAIADVLYRLQTVGGQHQRTGHEAGGRVGQQVDVGGVQTLPVGAGHVAEVAVGGVGEAEVVGNDGGLLVEGPAAFGVELGPGGELPAEVGVGLLQHVEGHPLRLYARTERDEPEGLRLPVTLQTELLRVEQRDRLALCPAPRGV